MSRPDRTQVLESTIKPVFIIGGALDSAVPLEVTRKMIEKIKVGEGLILEETGHNGFVEAEGESLVFIAEFLNKYL
jgi:pimeloyl-ACP methyl ester carboxylesterase